MTELYFSELTYRQVEELLESERATVLLFPVGATEPHGPHAPLATDLIISIGICERVASELVTDPELRALILPTLSFGVTRYAGGFGGAVHVGEEALRSMIVDACASLLDQGFRYIVLVNNHFEPEHLQTLHRAMDSLEESHATVVGYVDLTRRARAERLTDAFQRGESHADRYETSLVLAERPELVEVELMRSLPYVPVNLAKEIAAGKKDFREMGLTQAYAGAPAEASREEGEQIFAALVEMTMELIRDLVAGRGGRDPSGLFGRV